MVGDVIFDIHTHVIKTVKYGLEEPNSGKEKNETFDKTGTAAKVLELEIYFLLVIYINSTKNCVVPFQFIKR